MQPDDFGAERDDHTFQVADHGIDPSPMPGRARSLHARTGRPGSAPSKATDSFGLKDMLLWCGVPVAVVLLLRIFVFPLYWIPSSSMMDTIAPDDRVVTISTKILPASQLQRGDIVVFKDPANWLGDEQTQGGNGYLIKRLIGLPGDVVECAGAGYPITINGVAVDESAYVRPGSDPSSFSFKVTVTAGHVFVMGDNRAHSADSRFHQDDGDGGLVPLDDVTGKAVLTYWPISRIGLLDSHHEVFAQVPSGSVSR
ncbi:signal peptidase I [Bifidobacterium sp. UBA744]|uniref:signal peptidase I n=1 Tax=Bifidobacterium sp. UBA744 TaxID=1946112 RepID=UPI0025BCEA9C|nr:signal peptidase I [Bifidobacterium sp. UBA744]